VLRGMQQFDDATELLDAGNARRIKRDHEMRHSHGGEAP